MRTPLDTLTSTLFFFDRRLRVPCSPRGQTDAAKESRPIHHPLQTVLEGGIDITRTAVAFIHLRNRSPSSLIF